MPFLRIIRDRRGYETTYLIHWYREGQKQRSKVLFVFRSPSGVRVGRAPFESAVMREIEAQNPDISIAWDEVRASQQIVETSPEPRRRRPRVEPPEAADVETPVEPPPAAASAASPQPRVETVPAAVVGATSDEQISFLAHWYPLIKERLTNRASEPGRRDGLLALAERLNPAAWTDADELSEGLAGAAEALERLSHVLSRRRRSRRRGGAPTRAEQSPATS